jgi:hypothetical protein
LRIDTQRLAVKKLGERAVGDAETNVHGLELFVGEGPDAAPRFNRRQGCKERVDRVRALRAARLDRGRSATAPSSAAPTAATESAATATAAKSTTATAEPSTTAAKFAAAPASTTAAKFAVAGPTASRAVGLAVAGAGTLRCRS